MANAATAEDHVTLNLGEGGAVIATDFVSDANYGNGQHDVHLQVVKLSTGDAGEFALLSKSAPAMATIATIGDSGYLANGFIAVRGNTVGDQAVPVSLSGATLEVNEITIVGGTIDQITGASCDIRSIKAGITLSVVGIENDSVAVRTANDYDVAVTGAVEITSVSLPVGMTSFTRSFKQDHLEPFGGFTLSSGVKVKNYFSGLEGFTPGEAGPGGGLLCVGFTGTLQAGASTGYLLSPGEEVFIEIKNTDKLLATSVNFDGTNQFVNMSILGT
tara:strand:+ start:1305 stop:2126 length:822 start_codon:yes stop_codon:yes gene_type:complete